MKSYFHYFATKFKFYPKAFFKRPRKLQRCIWRDAIKPSLRFSWFCVLFPKAILFDFYFTNDPIKRTGHRGGMLRPFYKGDTIGDFRFAFLHTKPLLARRKTKARNFFPFNVTPFPMGRVINFESVSSWLSTSKFSYCVLGYSIHIMSLRKHAYSNILKISAPKTDSFQIKNSDIFRISAQNIDCGHSLEPPRQAEKQCIHV